MILAALILFFSFAASEPQNGFYPIVRTENRTRQSQQEHLVLTTDGRLQRLQLVFPQGTRVSEPQTGQYVLTPDGRIEQPQVEREYLKLTNEGKLQRFQKEELPQEETGEYHVILPDGTLQRVRYTSLSEDNRITARVMYQQVDPIRGPVYSYASPLDKILD